MSRRTHRLLVYRALPNSVSDRPLGRSWTFAIAAANVSAPRAQRVFAANSEIDLLIRNGNFAEAQKAVQGIAREADDFAFYYRKGIVADALGHDVDAQSAYQTAINKATKDRTVRQHWPRRDRWQCAGVAGPRLVACCVPRTKIETLQHRLDTRTRRS